jgi:hypothetical protein
MEKNKHKKKELQYVEHRKNILDDSSSKNSRKHTELNHTVRAI